MLAVLGLLPTLSAYAVNHVTIDGITYYLSPESKTAVVENGKECSGDVNILSSIKLDGVTYPVTSISFQAFYNCIGLTSVSIPEGVISIDTNAFRGCSSLTTVNIPNSVTSIGSSAFSVCI